MCENIAIVGKKKREYLSRKGQLAPRVTRDALMSEGKEFGLEVAVGDIIAVELLDVPTEQFMIGKVVRRHYVVREAFTDWMGNFEKGDDCVDVVKYEPVSIGASHYIVTEKNVPCFTDDIRVVNVKLDDVAVRRSARETAHSVLTRRTDSQFILPADVKAAILTKLSEDEPAEPYSCLPGR